jgi:hypothetical protein
MEKRPQSEKTGWADAPAFRKGLIAALAISAFAAAAAGFAPQWANPHPFFESIAARETDRLWRAVSPIFHALYGFVAFSFIVLAGQHLRRLVARKEDYYDERE